MEAHSGLGGGSWVCFPDSMLFRLPLAPDELNLGYFPSDREMAARASLPRSAIFGDVAARTKMFFCRHQHEADHLRRLMHTGVGLFIHQLESQLPYLIRDIVVSTPPGDLFPRPAMVAGDELVDPYGNIDHTERGAAVRMWFQFESLRKALLDAPGTDAEYVAALTLLNHFDGDAESLRVSPDVHQSPALPPALGGGTITGRHLLEFVAVLREMDWSGALADRTDPWQDLMALDSYHAVSLLWSRAFPAASLWDVRTEEELDRDLFLLFRRAYPLELHAAIDLALWPPLVPTGVHPEGGVYSWADVHPGHRFVRICEWFQRDSVEMTRLGGESRNERFRALQDRACRHFGWPAVDTLAGQWQACIRADLNARLAERNRLTPFKLEIGSHPYNVAVEALLQSRATAPCDLAVGNLPQIEQRVRPLGYITQNHEGYLVIGEFADQPPVFSPTDIRAILMVSRFLAPGPIREENPQYYLPIYSQRALDFYSQTVGDWESEFRAWSCARLGVPPSNGG